MSDTSNPPPPSWQHYEVWAQKSGKWDKVAWFRRFEPASAILRNYRYRARLVRVFYTDPAAPQTEVLAEVGATREEP